jgi:hypothetical protein
MIIFSAIFLKQIGFGTHRVTQNSIGRRSGGIRFIDARKKKSSGTAFRLRPSEKEHPERNFGSFVTKVRLIIIVCNLLKVKVVCFLCYSIYRIYDLI